MTKNEVFAFPTSFAQQRLWFLDQLVPGNPFYNVPAAIPLPYPIDVAVFEKSLREIVRRHEGLRTTFAVENGQPVQVIAAHMELPLPVINLRGLPPEKRDVEVLRLATEEARQPFDLAAGPLIRTRLLKLGEANYMFLLTIHHIVADGWSMGIFFQELTALYVAFAARQPSPLGELAIQYADFAVWQRDWFKGPLLQKQLGYWRERLANLPVLRLPTDRPRPAEQAYRGARYSTTLPPRLSVALKSLSQREGATLFMTVLAAFKALLVRYTGQDDIVVGSPIANRNRAEIEPLIGFFVNTLVLRTDCSGDPSFRELLRRVREGALGAYANQDLPFEMLVETLQPERDLSRNPLFQVIFQLLNMPTTGHAASAGPSSDHPVLNIQSGTSKFDLELDLWESAAGLVANFEYNTDIFDEPTIRAMGHHYQMLLEGIVANPDQFISRLPLLTGEEEERTNFAWNTTPTDYPREAAIHHRFEAQTQRTPETLALVFADAKLTYGALNARANKLAHYLRSSGVSPGSLVGVCLEPSACMVVSLLAILKAGGAYVPLDPNYPPGRLQFMLEDTGARVVLTQRSLAAALPDRIARFIYVDEEWDGSLAGQSEQNPCSQIGGRDLAYVIYTSGSTGKPKGVCIPHRAVIRLVEHTNYIRIDASDRVAQASNISFDAATFEIWGALLNGAQLIGLSREVALSPLALASYLRHEGITTLFLTTALFNQVAQEKPGAFSSLRNLLFGGEAVDPRWVRQVLRRNPPERLLHVYGPTETTTFATWHLVQDLPSTATTVPIGRPISNTQAYVLDQHLRPVPVGISGELCLGGDGLATGYLHRPELTAEKFVPHPFTVDPGDRLYKTGDLVRRRPDGVIEFLGRLDNQVKIRGFRIELDEIEGTLSEHAGILEAVVLAREETTGERRLVAYVVPAPEYRATSGEAKVNGSADRTIDREQVSHWQTIFDDHIYSRSEQEPDSTFNTVGWNSSYTGQPIPADEMRDWLEDTVDSIRSLQPRRVLEIGCGTGMLLFRVAPQCTRYVGTDISSAALDYIRQHIDGQMPQLTLQSQAADDFAEIEPGSFDTIVLNSVVQYFPSIEYLVRVLQGAIAATSPGGAVFLGDVRSFPLMDLFHTSVQLHKAKATLPMSGLLQRVQTQMMQEGELLVDPGFFTALQQQIPRIADVRIMPKRGSRHNELTKFRYQVILHIGDNTQPGARTRDERIVWRDSATERLTLADIRRLLTENREGHLGIEKIANARLRSDLAIRDLLVTDATGQVGALRGRAEALAEESGRHAIDPHDLSTLCEGTPYEACFNWARHGADGRFDVVFRRRVEAGGRLNNSWPAFPGADATPKPWRVYANDPLKGKAARQLMPELRVFLEARLPDYAIPAAFVSMATLPLSPNGKVDRNRLPPPDCMRPELEEAYVAPRSTLEQRLSAIWRQVLNVEQIGIHDNFFELGGDSILSIQIIARANQAGVRITPKQLFRHQTIAELAAAVETGPDNVSTETEQGILTGQAPLTPIQCWFFELELEDPHHFNQAVLFAVPSSMDEARLRDALDYLLRHHDALRLRFDRDTKEPGAPWRQVISAPAVAAAALSFSKIDLAILPEAEQKVALERMAADLQGSLNLSTGPLIRVALFDRGRLKSSRLLFIVHHLAIDGVSWRILLEDLQTTYQQLSVGEPVQLPPKTTSFRHWSERLTEYGRSETLRQELPFWLTAAPAIADHLPLDIEGSGSELNTVAFARTVSVALNREETEALLQDVPRAYHTQINDVLLTALGQAFAVWTGFRSLWINLEGHGREELFDDVDLSRTVGWFTSIFPVCLDLDRLGPAWKPGEALKSVKEQLRRIPNRGIGYGLLRYLSADETIVRQLKSLPRPAISFNYLGQFASAGPKSPESPAFETVEESTGLSQSPRGRMRHFFEINGSVNAGQLQVSWTYSERHYRQATIERLAETFSDALRVLIRHCQSPDAGGYTPSDFAKARLSQQDLDRFLSRFQRQPSTGDSSDRRDPKAGDAKS